MQNIHFQEVDDKNISALNVPDFQDDIQPDDSASQVTRQPKSGSNKCSSKTSGSRSCFVRSAH